MLGDAVNWTKALENVIPVPCFERPFICSGFPDSCDVVVLGGNPVTPLGVDWWSFWTDSRGFDYQGFLAFYRNRRLRRKENPLSQSRLRIHRLRENGMSCLEVNLFRSERPGAEARGLCCRTVLGFLLPNMPLIKAFIVHGDEAQRHFDSINLPNAIRIFQTRDLGQESYAYIDEICDEIDSL
jgi:hypothetical protein